MTKWSDDQFRCYPETVKRRVVSATEFKAKCLALFDEVEESGDTITITKRGRAVATVGPAKKQAVKSSMGILEGKIEVVGDIVNTNFQWDCVVGEREP